MNQTLDLKHLKRLPTPELRQHWVDLFPRKNPPKVKMVLLRDLTWQAQEADHGGMDVQTRSLLKAAIKQVEAEPVRTARPRKESPPRSFSARKKSQLQTGTKLIRTWRGKVHEVTVLENGKQFVYRDKAYPSLTQIAQQITGAHWSGPRFFGLNRVKSIR